MLQDILLSLPSLLQKCVGALWILCYTCQPCGWLSSLASLMALDACVYTVPILHVMQQITGVACDPLVFSR